MNLLIWAEPTFACAPDLDSRPYKWRIMYIYILA